MLSVNGGVSLCLSKGYGNRLITPQANRNGFSSIELISVDSATKTAELHNVVLKYLGSLVSPTS